MSQLDRIERLAKKAYSDQKTDLDRVNQILYLLDNPQNQYPVIHIAGTNGKGSTAAMLHSILQTAGYKSGLYTSPHFLSCNERIRINNHLITDTDLELCLAKVFSIPISTELSYFEILTVTAFCYFASKKIDFLVCETGLGGRLDATNAVKNKLVSIITSIDFDHTEILGDNLAKIAYEKAGIFLKGVPIVTNTGHAITDKILTKQSSLKNCPIFFYDRDFYSQKPTTNWQKLKQTFSYRGIDNNYSQIELAMLGEHQIMNATLALASIEIIKKQYPISNQSIYKGLKKASWSGRFEIRKLQYKDKSLTFILDGAHNAAGSIVLQKTLAASPYAKTNLVFIMNVLCNKDYQSICSNLSKLAKKVIILQLNNQRVLETNILHKEWQKYLPNSKIYIANNFMDVFKFLDNIDTSICVTGSLYVVAETLFFLKNAGLHAD